jgi:formylglycine-generating enzyme required for sulfatase activity
MHGNVWEWCHDAHGRYAPGPCTDPVVEGDTSERVARGGSYSNPPSICRSACRIGFLGGGRNEFIGLRVVVEHGAPPA